MNTFRNLSPLAVHGLLAILACSPHAEAPSDGMEESSFGPNAASGAGGGTGGFVNTVAGAPNTFVNTGGGSTSTLPDGSCASTSHAAENVVVTREVPVQVEVTTRSPVALYLMLDRSGSMLEPYYPPPNKWDIAKGAIHAFTNDSMSAGLGVALQLFPGDSGQCDGAGYDVPAVPMGLLPANAASINNYLAPQGANGGDTPIEGGLRGAIRYCAAYQGQNPERCVAVLITDGEPNGCNEDPGALAQIAADARAADDVLTFAIGMMGADFAVLDGIARAGGTDCTPGAPGTEACNVSGGGSSFIDALNTIRNAVTTVETRIETVTETQSTAVECEFELPAPPAGESFDREKVNVAFSSAANSAQRILQVPVATDCESAGGGWYYDNPASPTRIILCPSTCSTVQSITDARVDVLLGCATEVAVIQ